MALVVTVACSEAEPAHATDPPSTGGSTGVGGGSPMPAAGSTATAAGGALPTTGGSTGAAGSGADRGGGGGNGGFGGADPHSAGMPGTGAGGFAGSPSGGSGGELHPGDDTVVTVFDDAHVFWTGEQSAREIDTVVQFPQPSAQYERITLHFALGCPNGRCDPWDRFGTLGLLTNPGTDQQQLVEISRFMTPYGVGSSWDVDVTDLRPLLSGEVTLRVYIDTWVGPGSEYGDGWLVDASFEMTGGIPNPRAIAAVPVWSHSTIVIGDPARPPADHLGTTSVQIPPSSSAVALRTFITGHGQGNLNNCAEFCALDHRLIADGTEHVRNVWRDDCETTAAPGQAGTYQYSRAGWCPGAVVHAITVDLGAPDDATVDLRYDLTPYENTCRPGSPSCTGCSLGTGCDYDGGMHTEPNIQISAVLIAYE